MSIILASQSPRRRQLLGQIGLDHFIVRPARGEEVMDPALSPAQLVEELSPAAFQKVTGKEKVISANVDFYSGLVYEMLGIPEDLFTPMFAVSRIAGWCAHRIEELTTGGRIMRPAYRALPVNQRYVPLNQRG